MTVFLQILTLLGSVALFLFGLNLMSGGLQKVAGDGLRAFLASMTSNPLKRILTGMGVTAAIQSSTATTIMVVSFVNAGLLTLAQAIGVIMGANIGTTVTSWIMAVFGFSYDLSTISFPLILFGFLLMSFSGKNPKTRDLGEIIIGFAIFFVGFAMLRSTASTLISPESFGFLKGWTGMGFISVLLFLLIGTLLTICFQSSAATMAIIMLLITSGVIPFKMAAAMILGENIGTTIAANVAASIGNTTSKRAAMAHTVFNVFGVCWVLAIFPFFLKLIGHIVSAVFGLPDPNTVDFSAYADGLPSNISSSLLYSVTTMHTIFNLTNTLILVWFIPQIEKVVSFIIPGNPDDEEVFRLRYIQGGPLSTAELSLDEAKSEILHFGEICYKDFRYVRSAVNVKTVEELDELYAKLDKYEGITDRVEYEIASYLSEVSKGDISAESASRIKGMYRIIGEMESLGDSGEAIGRMMKRTFAYGASFSEDMLKKLNRMMDLVEDAFSAMMANLNERYSSLKDITNAQDAEYNINEYRNELREEHIVNIEKPGYDYRTGVFYMDIIADFEKMGDFIINISEAQISENIS